MADAEAEALAVYRLLQADDYRAVLGAADALLQHPDLTPGLVARLQAWSAQALTAMGRFVEARRRLRAAEEAAQAAGDVAGIDAITDLRRQLTARRLAAKPPQTLPDTPVGRACTAIDGGDLIAGERLSRAAVQAAVEARDHRSEVLAWLALARIPGRTAEAIAAAAVAADASNDHNLVTAVSHAARAAGVPLAAHVF